MLFLEFYETGSWLSVDAGMDAMGMCKVLRIEHDDRRDTHYILVDFLMINTKKRIKIKHRDILSKEKDLQAIKDLENRLACASLIFDIEEEERKEMYARQRKCKQERDGDGDCWEK